MLICFTREPKIRFSVLGLSLLALAGCGGGGGESPPPSQPVQTTVSGAVFASALFTTGVVKAYDFTSGVRGAQLASTSIGFSGTYQLTIIGTPGAVLIEADSGCYEENGIRWGSNTIGGPISSNAARVTVCATGPSLSAAVPFNATPLVVAVTPYTHAAVGLAQYEIRIGTATAAALNDANGRFSAWVGANVITTLPAVPVRSSATVSDPVLYGSLLAGIPTWLLNAATTAPAVFGTGSLTTLAFADAMKSDLLEDGVLNGTGRDANSSAVALAIGTVAMTTTIYRHQLAVNAVLRIRGETEGAQSATPEEARSILSFLPALEAYNNASNTLLDASPVIPLDEGGPVVRIGVPSAGATLTYNQGMDGYVRDIVGVPARGTVMLIDGIVYTPFVDEYHPNSFINTTIFENGTHVLTIRSTNNLGHTGSASVAVNFSN